MNLTIFLMLTKAVFWQVNHRIVSVCLAIIFHSFRIYPDKRIILFQVYIGDTLKDPEVFPATSHQIKAYYMFPI